MTEAVKDISDEKIESIDSGEKQEQSSANAEIPLEEQWQSDQPAKGGFTAMFSGWRGLAIMISGVVLPTLALGSQLFTNSSQIALMLFDHPIETIFELALLLNVPVSIYGAWRSQVNGFCGLSIWRTISLGASIGTSLLILGLESALIFGLPSIESNLPQSLTGLFCIQFISLLAPVLIADQVCRRTDFAISRLRFLSILGVGVAGATVLSAFAESGQWFVRNAEVRASSSSPKEQQEGLKILHSINPSRQLMLECTNSRAAGLCGLFMPLSNNAQRQLYFALTGEPFSFRDIHNTNFGTVSDERLANQLVGHQIEGLSLLRSSVSGKVNSGTLTAAVDWTFVFRNDTPYSKDAKAEIVLPAHAVATKFTLWTNGKPQDAIYYNSSASTDRVWNSAARFEDEAQPDPAIALTDIGNGRVLIDCENVRAQDEMKVRLSVVVPVKPETAETGLLTLPRFVATNFDFSDEHQVRLHSSSTIKSSLTSLSTTKVGEGDWLVSGMLKSNDITNHSILFAVSRPSNPLPVDTIYANAERTDFLRIEQFVRPTTSKIPSKVIVVVDGSSSINLHRQEVCDALKRLASTVATSVIISSSDSNNEPMPVKKAVDALSKVQFVGGQDNLQSVIKASELAGETAGGAVVWVHGPQSPTNSEIYIMSQYVEKPRFYDVPLASSATDITEFFKNYAEIGPFEMVAQEGAVGSALGKLADRWSPSANDYTVKFSSKSVSPEQARESAKNASDNRSDLLKLWAHEQCMARLNHKEFAEAAKLALQEKILTPISPASVVMNSKPSTSNTFLEDAREASNATHEQSQRSCIFHDNVRVNNLASLDVLLNMFANSVELLGLSVGAVILYMASFTKKFEGRRAIAFARGGFLILFGLATPGMMNWFVASARDANLFS